MTYLGAIFMQDRSALIAFLMSGKPTLAASGAILNKIFTVADALGVAM